MLLARFTFNYQPVQKNDEPLRLRIRDIAMTRVRYDFWRIYTLIRREGWKVNHKRVYRLYKLEGLNLRSKRPVVIVPPRTVWTGLFPIECTKAGVWILWPINSSTVEITLVDNFSRTCLAIHAEPSIKGSDVVSVMDQVVSRCRQTPQRIQVDNGSEFISKALDLWAYENKVTLDFSRPGKPTDNPYIESFNGSFRDECLNLHWFLSLEDARQKIESWRQDYNSFRPHSSLDGLTPNQFVEKQFEAAPHTSDSLLLTG